jgi:cell wall-associated NlpC family hydrolase
VSLILDTSLADDTIRRIATAVTTGAADMNPFRDSSQDLTDWLGKPNPKTGIPDTGNHTFFSGDDIADQTAHARGVSPTSAGNWLSLAKTQLGAPYVWATSNPLGPAGGPGGSFDCSGFTQWLVKRVTGVNLAHHAATQQQQTQQIGRDALQPGDLLFFRYGNGEIDHVEVYMGGGKSIGTSNPTTNLDISPVDWGHFVVGGRVPGMNNGAATGVTTKGAARAGRGRSASPPAGAPTPLTVPFAMGPANYFSSILAPLLTADPTVTPPAGPGKSPQLATKHASPSDIQAAAKRMVLARGWSLKDFNALVQLWNRESGWNPDAVNSSSGATGIPQLNPNSHEIPPGWNDPMVQIRWGLSYIAQRYGSPSAAWQHSQSTGWY